MLRGLLVAGALLIPAGVAAERHQCLCTVNPGSECACIDCQCDKITQPVPNPNVPAFTYRPMPTQLVQWSPSDPLGINDRPHGIWGPARSARPLGYPRGGQPMRSGFWPFPHKPSGEERYHQAMKHAKQSRGRVLVVFSAGDCELCPRMDPLLSMPLAGVDIVCLDRDKDARLAGALGVSAVPYMALGNSKYELIEDACDVWHCMALLSRLHIEQEANRRR